MLSKSSYGDTDNMKAKLKKVGFSFSLITDGPTMFSLSMRHQQKREEAEKRRQKEKVRIDNVPVRHQAVPYYKYFQEEQRKMEEENRKTEDKEAK